MKMNFGQAIEALKNDQLVRRAGWNGKGMHLYLERDSPRYMPRATKGGKVSYEVLGYYEPCIVMFTAEQKYQPGWLASQADILAEDWEIVEPSDVARAGVACVGVTP